MREYACLGKGGGGEMKERSLESFGRNECVCLGEGGGRWRAEGRGEMNEKNVVRWKWTIWSRFILEIRSFRSFIRERHNTTSKVIMEHRVQADNLLAQNIGIICQY